MDQSFTPPRSPFDSQKDNIASERLRKAIERNRAKQRQRSSASEAPSGVSATEAQRSFWGDSSPSTTPSVRRGVATANNVEFSTDIEAARPRSQVPVSYISAKRKVKARRKKKSDLPAWLESSGPIDYFVKACWIFAFILLGRLIISSGGVVDYYSKKSLIESKVHERDLILSENGGLVHEIDAIKNDQAYQRKLVRDHLGFIAKDEYLILFHQARQNPSI